MTKRSSITWDHERDAELIKDLDRYKARCRGRRLKDLALQGLWMESTGLRLLIEATLGQAPPELVASQPASVGGPDPTAAAEPTVSSEHKRGLDALFDSLVID